MIKVISLPPLATAQDLGRDGHWFEGLGRAPGATVQRRTSAKAFSPTTGLFHPRGGDDALPELRRGTEVQKDEPLGYIGIGPILLPCLSPATGRITGALPTPQETFCAGTPVFTVESSP